MSRPTPEQYRAVIGRFATGVTVMATEADGEPHGMTANAISSLSLEPLLVLVCVERTTNMVDAVATSGAFALSVLTVSQRDLSTHFADPDRAMGDDQFDGIETHRLTTGSPVLDRSLGALDCVVWATYDGGDHVIVVGEVVDLETGEDAPALTYFRSTYGSVDVPPRGG